MIDLNNLNVKIFADGANLEDIKKIKQNPLVKGFTTNPTLMRQAGVECYETFAKQALEVVDGMPISFEVFSDDLDEMRSQAKQIASWGSNVNVKIPVVNTRGESTASLVKELSDEGIVLNITAIFTPQQIKDVVDAINPDCGAIISVFAGRIADTGIDPVPAMRDAVNVAKAKPKAELLWASPREPLNIVQADETGCHIITVTPAMLGKAVGSFNKDLGQFSLETVKMFYDDASASGFSLSGAASKQAA